MQWSAKKKEGFDHKRGKMKLSKVNKTLDMNTTLQHRLTQFWQHIQISLFPLLEEIELVLTPKLQELVTALEMM